MVSYLHADLPRISCFRPSSTDGARDVHHHHRSLRRDSDDATYYKQFSWSGGDRLVLPRDPASLDQKEKATNSTYPSEDHQEKKSKQKRQIHGRMHMQCMTTTCLVRSGGPEASKEKSRVMECILHSQEQAVIGRVFSLRGVEEQLGSRRRSPTRMWRGRGREYEHCSWLGCRLR
jgi:hypothetical protein